MTVWDHAWIMWYFKFHFQPSRNNLIHDMQKTDRVAFDANNSEIFSQKVVTLVTNASLETYELL